MPFSAQFGAWRRFKSPVLQAVNEKFTCYSYEFVIRYPQTILKIVMIKFYIKKAGRTANGRR
ncbi:hypothetical protein K040078D81_09820 [Blautia hominis]|uniref:Uncharacterized protein n=1 Tax=Blautia hominis TaxID=2025493 RepID=A0ABQ0B5Z1_9FIRM